MLGNEEKSKVYFRFSAIENTLIKPNLARKLQITHFLVRAKIYQSIPKTLPNG